MRVATFCPLLLLLSVTPAAAVLEGKVTENPSGIRGSVVRVESSNGNLCSGALIAPDIVLTAAHCIVERVTYRVVAIDSAFQRRQVSAIAAAMHPAFVPGEGPRTQPGVDLAIVRLEVALGPDFHPFRADAPVMRIEKGQAATVAGFGVAVEGQPASAGVLREARLVNLGTLQVANRVVVLADERHKGAVPGAGTCRGDDGAPVFLPGDGDEANQLLGIVSWSSGALSPNDGAACGGLTAMTPVADHIGWISVPRLRAPWPRSSRAGRSPRNTHAMTSAASASVASKIESVGASILKGNASGVGLATTAALRIAF